MTTTTTEAHAARHAHLAPRAGGGCGCGCGCGTHDPCAPEGRLGLERTRWFPRMLVGPEDLIQDQRFVRDALRRHNRLLHGYGVVCGLRVRAAGEEGERSCRLVVEPGYALGPWGDEIVVPEEVTIDACAEDGEGHALGPCGEADPWCAPVRVRRDAERPLYLAVRHAECDTRPVRVVGGDCGCDETACEYSRTRMSFAVKLLAELPESHAEEHPPDLHEIAKCPSAPPCPPCPPDAWVVLADVRVVGDVVEDVDCSAHRRHVLSFAPYWHRCGEPRHRLSPKHGFRALVEERPERLAVAARRPERTPTGGRPPAGAHGRIEDAGEDVVVTARRPGGDWLVLPMTLAVEGSETIAEVIARNPRTYLDPETGDRYDLAEIVAAAGIDPSEPVGGARRLAARLEQVPLGRVHDLRVATARLDELLDEEGRAALGDLAPPDRALKLPATALAGLAPGSTLGKRLAETTIGELAGMDAAELERIATRRLPAARREEVLGQARPLLDAATSVRRLADGWRSADG
jgi:hypothetical protein